jgi:hypothetical protein
MSYPKQKCKILTTSHLKPKNAKKTITYGIGNPGPWIEQTQKCGGVKPVKEYIYLSTHCISTDDKVWGWYSYMYWLI